MKIIVVDTDRDTSALVAFALRQDGHLALEIADLAAALPAIAREEPCLVVLAAQHDRRISFDLCQAIRARSSARVLLINGPATEEAEVAALDLGADAYEPAARPAHAPRAYPRPGPALRHARRGSALRTLARRSDPLTPAPRMPVQRGRTDASIEGAMP